MLFNSFTFIVFFAIVFVVYYLLPNKLKWLLLLAASLVFYMWWKAELIVLILVSTFNNYSFALLIKNSQAKKLRRTFLSAALAVNFLLLFIFKYLVFSHNLISFIIGSTLIENFNILLPMGISFYTFQASAYTIDVYRNEIEPQKNYLKFMLFIIFFPQLVAGPIERSKNLMPQLFSPKRFNMDEIVAGFKIAVMGFFKKVVIADRAAFFVNGVFNSVEYYGFPGYTIATVLFAFQIYCDFSGYSDIATGCSKMLGINLMQNFNHPYFSHNLKDFWRRWHISLSTWFKDYLYFPLGGNRVSKGKHYRNLLATFMISGLWHGANMTFVLWGALHGIFQIIGSIKNSLLKPTDFQDRNPIAKLLSVLMTFGLTCALFAIFRANSLSDVYYMFTHFFWGFRAFFTAQGFYTAITALPATLYELIAVCLAIVFLMVIEFLEGDKSIHDILNKKNVVIKFSFYLVVIIAILALGVFSDAGEFIYFQF